MREKNRNEQGPHLWAVGQLTVPQTREFLNSGRRCETTNLSTRMAGGDQLEQGFVDLLSFPAAERLSKCPFLQDYASPNCIRPFATENAFHI